MSSPSTTALSESGLNEKALCDYVLNVAEGCKHGCTFCYVPSTPPYRMDPGDKLADAGVEDPAEEWGDYVLYRDKLPVTLANTLDGDREWRTTRKGQGVVGISFGTDAYQSPRAAKIAIQATALLVKHDKPVRILTRNPTLAADLHGDKLADLAEEGEVTVGTSIPSINQEWVGAIEPMAPPVQTRLDGLERLEDAGVPVFVSMSPTYPTMGRHEIEETLKAILDRVTPTVIFHEPVNPRAGNIERSRIAAAEAGLDELAGALAKVKDREEWASRAVEQFRTVQVVAKKSWMDAPVHLWPDKGLTSHVSDDVGRWLREWRDRPSPEEIGDGSAPTKMPELPEETLEPSSSSEQTTLVTDGGRDLEDKPLGMSGVAWRGCSCGACRGERRRFLGREELDDGQVTVSDGPLWG